MGRARPLAQLLGRCVVGKALSETVLALPFELSIEKLPDIIQTRPILLQDLF